MFILICLVMHGSAIYLRRASNTGYKTEKTKEKNK